MLRGAWAPLAGATAAADQGAALQAAVHTSYAWMDARESLMLELGILSPALPPQFWRECQRVLLSELPSNVPLVLQAYVASSLHLDQGAATVSTDVAPVVAELRVLGVDALVQTSLTQAATSVLEEAVERATLNAEGGALDRAVYPQLHALLRDTLLPALTALLEARPSRSTPPAVPGHAAPALPDLWDVSVADAAETRDERHSLLQRLDYSLAQAIGARRLSQLFELMDAYPRSRAALGDIVAWLDTTDERAELARVFSHMLHTRLLHPGVATHAILVSYVNVVYALRLVDASGVVLSQVLPPVQRYLRTRPDTVEAVVHALLGDDSAFALLRMELERSAGDDAPWTADVDDGAYTLASSYWQDPTWAPRPVDAGPEYSQMRSRDVVGLLVSIFDNHDGFVQALEKHTAQLLVKTRGYDTARIERHNAIFKRRLGESLLHHCDVMLGDVARSRALDARFHDETGAAPDAVHALHPIVISRQFWPDIASGTYTLPRRLSEALDAYAAYYARTEPRKRLKWLPYLGTVDLDIELEDGRRVAASATPLQAAVIELVAGLSDEAAGAGDAPVSVTAANVAAALGVDDEAALAALRFWTSHGIWRELPAPATGAFEVC